MHYFLYETFDVFVYEFVQEPTYDSHHNQYGTAQHIKHNEEYVNTEVNDVVRGAGFSPTFSDR